MEIRCHTAGFLSYASFVQYKWYFAFESLKFRFWYVAEVCSSRQGPVLNSSCDVFACSSEVTVSLFYYSKAEVAAMPNLRVHYLNFEFKIFYQVDFFSFGEAKTSAHLQKSLWLFNVALMDYAYHRNFRECNHPVIFSTLLTDTSNWWLEFPFSWGLFARFK